MDETNRDFDSWTDEVKWQFLTRHERLGEVLVKQGRLTLEQLEKLLAEQADSDLHIGQIIVSKGLLSLDDILSALNQQHLNDKVSLESIIELRTKQKGE